MNSPIVDLRGESHAGLSRQRARGLPRRGLELEVRPLHGLFFCISIFLQFPMAKVFVAESCWPFKEKNSLESSVTVQF